MVDRYDGGTLQGAHQGVWPILQGQFGSAYLITLKPNGIRQPHWHTIAWEMNYVISGTVKWSILAVEGVHDSFIASTGDVVFIPQGHFHYFENADDTNDLVVLVVFNTSVQEAMDDIGIVASISAIPADVLGAMFGVPQEVFENIPKNFTRIPVGLKTMG